MDADGSHKRRLIVGVFAPSWDSKPAESRRASAIAAEMLFSDIMFVSIRESVPIQSLTSTNPAEAEILRNLFHNARNESVVAVHSKLGLQQVFRLPHKGN
jgi:hypothetical protein